MQLPDAKVDKLAAHDKLSFYAMAIKDSAERVELKKFDPNLSPVETDEDIVEETSEKAGRVRRVVSAPVRSYRLPVSESSTTTDVQRLQEMVQTLQQPRTDPDMEALNGTLQQLVALQQPKTATEVASEPKRKAYVVTTQKPNTGQGFFGESGLVVDSGIGTIKAVIHGEQIIQSGSVIKLRLLTDVFVRETRIPAGSFVFGLAGIGSERISIEISSIQFNGSIYPVSLRVMDMDGMEGIYIPGSTTREVVKQAAEQGVQSVGLVAVDQSLKAQAAAAGIGAAKTLLSRKARQVRVTIKSGYQVLFKDDKRSVE